jgi:hypothetical protein
MILPGEKEANSRPSADSPVKRPTRQLPQIPAGFGGFQSGGPGHRTEEELDQEFFAAISRSPLKERLNNPQVHVALDGIYNALCKLQGTSYLSIIKRLELIPALALDYEAGLERLVDMGFTDREFNLEVLKKCYGDVDDAIEWMIQNDKI